MVTKTAVCLLVLICQVMCTSPPDAGNVLIKNLEGTATVRQGCRAEQIPPPGRRDSTDRLQRLREEMIKAKISAYIITTHDQHQSEYLADHDKRRAFISGFTGSAGDAVVTLQTAALWTDSRYYLQAESQLDCNWVLMRTGYTDVPSIPDFIISELKPGEVVSADPKIITWRDWTAWDYQFSKAGLKMEVLLENLVDNIWGEEEERPPYPDVPLFVLDVKYAGMSWHEKLAAVRKTMADNYAKVLVLSALDEIAWLLNLRGGDVPFTPVFRSYLMIGTDWATLYLPSDKIYSNIEDHLNSLEDDDVDDDSIRIKNYEAIWKDLPELDIGSYRIWLTDKYSYAGGASYLLYKSAPEGRVLLATSPVLIMKDYKNEVEAQGMYNAHVRDAVALCQLLSRLEKEITSNNGARDQWDELTVAVHLERLRKQQSLSLGPSFDTIAAFGPNTALPHYSATPETNRIINSSSLFMLDSGGQYLDGTTDVTRTVHFGTPREREKEIYTHLLMGCIDIASAVFPSGQSLSTLEILIRAPLYRLGLNYGHGSTHGIGSCLAVHEAFNTTYHLRFFGSQEPGYYDEAERFGMRLENIVTVTEASVQTKDGSRYLTFEPVTLVPYESKLIKPNLMSKRQLVWLNNYHKKVRNIVGKEMIHQGLRETYEWLLLKTQPIGNL